MASMLMRKLLLQPLRASSRTVLPPISGFVRSVTHQASAWNDQQLDQTVRDNKVVVFMKGTPDSPMCGFSRAVIQILDMHGLVNYKTFDVLEDDNLRKNIKEYSSWPTIPQIYINGEFVGGCDILIQMHRSGDLIDELEKIGHRSALLEEDEE